MTYFGNGSLGAPAIWDGYKWINGRASAFIGGPGPVFETGISTPSIFSVFQCNLFDGPVIFSACVWVSGSIEAEVELINMTSGLQISNGIIQTTSNIPSVISVPLNSPSDIPSGIGIYGAKLKINSPTINSNDRAFCAFLKMEQ